ncbi:MAG: aminotransferase [Pseudomonadota bacterium]
MRLNPALEATIAAPIMVAQGWIKGRTFPEDKPLINMAQGVPSGPPPETLRQAMAEAMAGSEGHLYGPVLGNTDLREAIADRWSMAYGAALTPDDVAVTAGCNQAFCAALSTVAAAGDAVLLPSPYYFNHLMWCQMNGIEAQMQPVNLAEGALPDVEHAASLLTERTRAIVLVTPNNPTGAVYPPALIDAFFDLAAERGIALILDETYRDALEPGTPPHPLFQRPDWRETLIHLYSFSKVYRLTGHRTGAMIAGPRVLAETEKFLDTVSICAPQLGQAAAVFGLQNLGDWVAAERQTVTGRLASLKQAAARLPSGWEIASAGAFFAYLRHPFEQSSAELAPDLVDCQSLLALPGTLFAPPRETGGDGSAERHFRLAFANADAAGINAAIDRLAAYSPA